MAVSRRRPAQRRRPRPRPSPHEGDETKVLALQAQGAAGLTAYALRGVRVRLGEALQTEGVFDRDGRLHIVLDDKALSDAELSLLEIELLDLAP